MKHILFGSNTNNLKVAILIKTTAMNKGRMERHYIEPQPNLPADAFIAFNLTYNDAGKCPAALAKECIAEVLVEVKEQNIDTIMVCDASYFKFLTKNKKADPHYGYICPCAFEGYEHIGVILCPNYQAMMYNPALQEKIDKAIATLDTHLSGSYKPPGENIIHSAYYPHAVEDISRTLEALHKFPELSCDIETKGLEFWNCGLSTISFAWDKHNGVAFGIDRCLGPEVANHREPEENKLIRKLLLDFLVQYPGKLTGHNWGFDAKILVYELWMNNLMDYPGMIEGIKVLTRNFDDTKIIAYLATNNAVKNELSLKVLSADYTGNYAQEDIKDTEKIPLPELLEYNLIDCLATHYVKEKYEPIMIQDEQLPVYTDIMKKTTRTLLQTELCGMPINPEKVQVAKKLLSGIVDKSNAFFIGSKVIQKFHQEQLVIKAKQKTAEAKAKAKTDRATKVYTIEDSVIAYDFNPASNTQLSKLLYDYLEYPVLDLTKSKQPSCSGKTIEKLKAHSKSDEDTEMFEHLKSLADASIILSTFIPAFENAQLLPDGSYRLYGNFNATGSQSLRLSSNSPNLMNIPSGSVFAKIVKECFTPITGWLFVGSDFDAIEDKTNALLTRDPEKLKIYEQLFCGHCVRAYRYWPEKMQDIDPTSPDSVNSIKKKYKKIRQDSKAPSFAMQYGGTFITLMKNCGFSEVEAKKIEANYLELYSASTEHMEGIIELAKETGYIPMAFGARIRTPLLAKSLGNGRSVPYAAKAEARSAGNAYTQSYCVLTLRAFNEFLERLWASPYIEDILPACTIHDAIYLMVRDSATIMQWVNDNLIECMAWNDLPELQHDAVKMTSALEIFWPSWANSIDIDNKATADEIKKVCRETI